jgi:alpha-tubulin suppressor-like RCC1 family protein
MKKLILSLGLVSILAIWAIGAKSCINRTNNNVKTGSSDYNSFAINAPLGLSATGVSSFQINLIWQDNSNNDDGFEMERKAGEYGIWASLGTIEPTITSYSDSAVILGVTYYYRVRAVNTIGDTSAWSNEASTTTLNFVWVAVTAGDTHVLALNLDGMLWSWGNNESFQLGIGNTSDNYLLLPNQIGTDVDWNRIAGGAFHSLAIKTDRTLWSWGGNGSGQLGLGDTDYNYPEPYQVEYPLGMTSDWAYVSAGSAHTVVIKANPSGGTGGTMWSCGENLAGQLGLGSDLWNKIITTPTQIGLDSNWSIVKSSYMHSVALKSNRTLWGWGWNLYGQLGGDYPSWLPVFIPSPLGTDSDWITLATSMYNVMGGKTNGTLWGCGLNSSGQLGVGDTASRSTLSQIGNDSDWVSMENTNLYSIASGAGHTVAIKTTGSLWTWGGNSFGQLGLGISNSSYIALTPAQIGTDTGWSAVIAGDSFSVGLKTNGTLWSWGNNSYGQLGLGDTDNRIIPTLTGIPPPVFPTSLTVTAISSSQINLAWQDNSNNEDGFKMDRKIGINGTWEQIKKIGSDINYYYDTEFPLGNIIYYRVRAYNGFGNSSYSNELLVNCTQYAPSSLSAMIGSLNQINLSWNDNSDNESGFKLEIKISRFGSYVQVATIGANINSYSYITDTSFASNTYYYCRIRAYDALGDSIPSNESCVALSGGWLVPFGIPLGAVSGTISAGNVHTLALKTDNKLWAWGDNGYGQLGDGTADIRVTPSAIGGSDWLALNCGYAYSLGIKTNRTLWAWGDNGYGQLGDINIVDSTIPNQIGAESDWSMFSGGDNHSLGLKTNRILWAWGDNEFGQLGDSDIWNYDQRQIGASSDWLILACGSNHSLGLKTNRTLWVWGLNSSGQLGDGTTTNRTTPRNIGATSDWSMLSGGENHSLGIKTNCTLWAWGKNDVGQLGLGYTSISVTNLTPIGIDSDWVVIASGDNHAIALKNNGAIWSWGDNQYGQLGLGDPYEIGANRATPTQIGTNSDCVSIVTGGLHSIAIKTNGTLWAWGRNFEGQLGLGDTVNRNVPTLIGE